MGDIDNISMACYIISPERRKSTLSLKGMLKQHSGKCFLVLSLSKNRPPISRERLTRKLSFKTLLKIKLKKVKNIIED